MDVAQSVCARQVIFAVDRFGVALRHIRRLLERGVMQRGEGAGTYGAADKAKPAHKGDIRSVQERLRLKLHAAQMLRLLPDAAGVGGNLRNVHVQCWESVVERLTAVRDRLSKAVHTKDLSAFEQEAAVLGEIETDLNRLSHYAADVMQHGEATDQISREFEQKCLAPPPLKTSPPGERRDAGKTLRLDPSHPIPPDAISTLPSEAPYDEEQYVTLRQAAALVSRQKRALEYYRRRCHQSKRMPEPTVRGTGGKPDEWLWSVMRPWLEKTFGRKLRERLPDIHRT